MAIPLVRERFAQFRLKLGFPQKEGSQIPYLMKSGILAWLDVADGVRRPEIVSGYGTVDFTAFAIEGDGEFLHTKRFADTNDQINETHGPKVVFVVCARP
jgi:hypothetical protein